MGRTTVLTSHSTVSPRPAPHSPRLNVDVPLLLAVCSLVVIGLLMVYSASWNYALRNGEPPGYVLGRQVLWVLLGGVFGLFLAFIDYHHFQRWITPVMGITLLMLFIVLFNTGSAGPTRTLFYNSIQPSELAKLVIVVYLSVWLYSKQDQLGSISLGLLPIMVILGIISGLILLEPDISAAATVVILGGILFFLAGGELRQIVLVVAVGILLGVLIVTVSDTGRQRLTDYTSGLQEPEQASYHVKRSMEAVVRGGLFGVGIGKGTTKFTGLPVPWTDSIFAVIAEETGLIGAVLVTALYLIFLWRGLQIAQRAPDGLGFLLAAGITIWITLEALINIGVMVNLIPFAGNALPLMSAGGSSMTTTLAGIGILINVSRTNGRRSSTKEGRTFGAVIDLRRRDWRRSVPRDRRSAGTAR